MILAASAALLLAVSAAAAGPSKVYEQARELYQKGLYEKARALFGEVSAQDPSPLSDGYALLCSMKLKDVDCRALVDEYFVKYPESALYAQIRYQNALNMFDEGDFEGARSEFASFSQDKIDESQMCEYLFKRAYCDFSLGDYEKAKVRFEKVNALNFSDYTAPARYALGYISYSQKKFQDAIGWFSQTEKDPRFAQQSQYYLLESQFVEKNYKYVIDNGQDIYEKAPVERQTQIARLLSEAYLVMGQPQKAREFYDRIIPEFNKKKSRSDFFYSGSVLYAVKDYKGAVDNFSMMTSRADSLGQIASYQMGFSYVQLKDKVSAMKCFKEASDLGFDADIQEDAFFNYAKLAFDLNHDSQAFNDYLSRWSSSKRGDLIYSYIALASLYNHDYASAVAAYDSIDELSDDMRGNYMKANFLRANQLISNGSYRDAISCLRAAAFYTDHRDPFNQLTRYWLAESYFRSENYDEAEKIYTELYNLSALDGREEGANITYGLGYCNFQKGAFATASKWFDKYVEQGSRTYRRDAQVRRADCDFLRKDYDQAALLYQQVITEFGDVNDIYPYYQLGLAYGLSGEKTKKVTALSPVKTASPDAFMYPEAMYELGRAYVDAGRTEDAVGAFTQLRNTSKDSTYIARSLIELGMIERNRQSYDKALSYYKQVVEKLPRSGFREDALMAVESIYQTKGEPEVFIAYAESVGNGSVKTAAEKESIYFNSAEQVFLNGNYQKAIVALEKYLDNFPAGQHVAQADFYNAESYRAIGKKEKACDYYALVQGRADAGSFAEPALLNYASLSYSLEHYADAYKGYDALLNTAKLEDNVFAAKLGRMRSAFRAKDYANAIGAATLVFKDDRTNAAIARESEYVKAKSFLATSHREEAFDILEALAKSPATDEGAEASYLIIQDTFDRGRFDEVEGLVYKFSGKAESQSYWLAKAFIVLGDSFVEKGNVPQAKATFESVLNGYVPAADADDVLENVRMRLQKLSEMK